MRIFYPAPPDEVRMQFLTSYSHSEDFTGAPSRLRTFVAGKAEPDQIQKPYGIAVDNGRIFIADPSAGQIHLLHLEEQSYELFRPGGRGSLKLPVNCYCDSEGKLYVADVERQQVVIFNKELEYINEIGGDEQFKPTDVLVAGDTILVTDPRNNCVNAYDRLSCKKLFSFPEGAGAGDEEWLYNPVNLAVSGDRFYITDFGHSTIKIYNRSGEYLSSVGSYGRDLGQFTRPKGIAVDRNQNLFVVDAGFQNVQVFDPEGQLLMFFGGAYQGKGDLYLPAKVSLDYQNTAYFSELVDPDYTLIYLIYVTSQYGPDKVNVYGRVQKK